MLAGSLISVGYLSVSLLIKITLMLGLVAYSLRIFYSHKQWQAIGHDFNGWYLGKAGSLIPIVPSGDSTITSFVSILRFKQDKKWLKQSCIIFRDSLSDDNYRRFLVRMKYFKEEPMMVSDLKIR
jgi:hypothetical protein